MPYKPHVLIMSWHDLLTRLTNKTHSECHLLQRDMLVSLRGKHQGCLWCKTSRRYHSPPGMHIYVRLFCTFVHWKDVAIDSDWASYHDYNTGAFCNTEIMHLNDIWYDH